MSLLNPKYLLANFGHFLKFESHISVTVQWNVMKVCLYNMVKINVLAVCWLKIGKTIGITVIYVKLCKIR